MDNSRQARVARVICRLLNTIAAVIVAYTAWFVVLETAGEFKDRMLEGVLYLMVAAIFFSAGKGVRAALIAE